MTATSKEKLLPVRQRCEDLLIKLRGQATRKQVAELPGVLPIRTACRRRLSVRDHRTIQASLKHLSSLIQSLLK
ncbi:MULTISPECIES: hypothetical protein [unclassified Streptomyces]|uniref:hypothetical protein n=1 Tax=unclassified Streptomyces TaxID=2593676 RepID=UPI002E2D65EA|nr:hypothetical protein [Streptomyces sp. NBC_00273]